jgi:ribosomal protein L21E
MHSQNTDTAGAFVFDDVAPGTYLLQAVKAGFVKGAYGSQSAEAPPLPVTLKAGQSMKDVVIKLTAQGVITGQVTDQDGEPAQNVEVTAYKFRYFGGRKTLQEVGNKVQVDDEGWFRLARLDPGRYYVSAAPSRSMAARTAADVKTLYPSASDLLGAVPLEVTPGARLAGIDIRLRREPVYSIKGKVTRNGSPVDAWVGVLTKDASAQRWSAQTSKGAFEMQGLPAGKYTLEARVGDQTHIVINTSVPRPPRTEPTFSGRTDVSVDGSNLDGVVIALESDVELSGAFRAEDGSLEDLAKSVSPPDPPADPFEMGFLTAVSWEAGLNVLERQNATLRPMVDLVPANGSEARNAAVMREDGTFRISRPRFVPGSYSGRSGICRTAFTRSPPSTMEWTLPDRRSTSCRAGNSSSSSPAMRAKSAASSHWAALR